jgi:hypothetical protein
VENAEENDVKKMRKLYTEQLRNLYLQSVTWDNSVGIATGWLDGVRFMAGARDFSLLHIVQTGAGAHPASYAMGTDHSSPAIAEFKKTWVYTSTPPYVFMV